MNSSHCLPGACAPMPCSPCCDMTRRYLVDRILCSGREWIRCLDTCLCITGICDCLPAPLTLTEVCYDGGPVEYRECAGAQRGALVYEVDIPLRAVIQDAACCTHVGCTKICVRVCIPLNCSRGECWQTRVVFVPAVRLVCGPVCSQGLSFDARLECVVEAYLVRPEAVGAADPCCKPAPRPLPLYPVPYDPCRHS